MNKSWICHNSKPGTQMESQSKLKQEMEVIAEKLADIETEMEEYR